MGKLSLKRSWAAFFCLAAPRVAAEGGGSRGTLPSARRAGQLQLAGLPGPRLSRASQARLEAYLGSKPALAAAPGSAWQAQEEQRPSSRPSESAHEAETCSPRSQATCNGRASRMGSEGDGGEALPAQRRGTLVRRASTGVIVMAHEEEEGEEGAEAQGAAGLECGDLPPDPRPLPRQRLMTGVCAHHHTSLSRLKSQMGNVGGELLAGVSYERLHRLWMICRIHAEHHCLQSPPGTSWRSWRGGCLRSRASQ